MALHRDGDVVVAVGSNGRSPAVAKTVRDQIAAQLARDSGQILDVVAAERDALRSRGESTEDVDWDPVIARAQTHIHAQER